MYKYEPHLHTNTASAYVFNSGAEIARTYTAENGLPMTAGNNRHSTQLLDGGILTKTKFQSCANYLAPLKDSKDYFLTDNERIYDRYS